MYFRNITNLYGVDIGNPLIYTGNQSKRIFSKANSLLEHVNVYDRPSEQHVNYLFFSELKGKIKRIVDSETITSYTLKNTEERFLKYEYNFSELKELLFIEKYEGNYKEEVRFTNSLKKIKVVSVTKYYNAKKHSVNRAYFNDVMEYEKFEEQFVWKNEKRTILNEHPRREKYIFRDNKVCQKIRFINNSKEQSKVRIYFDSNSNIIKTTAYDQRKKNKLLYQSFYKYNDSNNIDLILYQKYNEHESEPIVKKYNFKYDENDNLIETDLEKYFYDDKLNLISIISYNYSGEKSFEKNYSYKYDSNNNWEEKTTRLYNYNNGVKKMIKEIKTKRTIQYY